ncbi:MAG: hypothetical protein WCG73_02825, partial [Candidatus Moraniibacteriota bacterium]
MMLASVFVISFVFNLLQKGAGKETVIGSVLGLVAIAIGFIVQLGLIRVYLDLAEGTKDELKTLFSQYRLFWNYFGAVILYMFVVVLGFILFIFPGIYFSLKYQFYSYLIVDKNLNAIEALKRSAVMTDGVKWNLLGFSFVLCGLNILGLLVIGLGLLVTVPMSIMAYVYVYRTLRDRGQSALVVAAVSEPAVVIPTEPVVVAPEQPV